MNKCPHCDHKALGIIRKSFLGPARSVSCKHCGTNLTVPFNAQTYVPSLIFIGALAAGTTISERVWLSSTASNALMLLWFALFMIHHVVFVPLVEFTQGIAKRVANIQIIILGILALSAIVYVLWQYA